MTNYQEFLQTKRLKAESRGFEPIWLPDFLFPFQRHCVDWSIRLGRTALFQDCGLGKTPQQLVVAENIVRKTNKNVLVLTPLAVAPQTVREGKKFDIECKQTRDGIVHKGINVTNYHQLHKYNPEDFVAIICDESSILKGEDRTYRKQINTFMQRLDYRLLATATPAPNDFMELGTSSEALGNMTRNQMLAMFFTNDGDTTQQWSLKGHAKKRFWQWVATWARAVRKPSDLGFDDDGFILPPLKTHQHILSSPNLGQGFFADMAVTLQDQRAERKRTLRARCEKVASLIPKNRPALVWCHLNDEGDLLEKLIPDAVQVAGRDKDEIKEERLNGFSTGQIRVLVTKPSIAGWGLNWQHCSDVFFFPHHSFEAFYQAIRRCWRFGQKNEVNCHLITSEAERLVMDNMLSKERGSAEMFDGIVRHMNDVLKSDSRVNGYVKMEVPNWLKGN